MGKHTRKHISRRRQTRRRLRSSKGGASGTNGCPAGYTRRAGYVRRYKQSVLNAGYDVDRDGQIVHVKPHQRSVTVSAQCVKDTGLAGRPKEKLGVLQRGELIKYGYNYRLATEFRRNSLRAIISKLGRNKTYHKLLEAARLSKRVSPKAAKVFETDANWIRYSHKV